MAKLTKTDFIKEYLKEELVEALEGATVTKDGKVRVTSDLSSNILNAVANAYINAVVETQQDVGFGDLGTFKTKIREARTGRNPQTGEEMEIPEQLTTRLSLGKAFKDALKNAEI